MFKSEQTVSARNERIIRWANPFVRSWLQYSTSVQRSRTKQRRPIRDTFRSWNLPERSEGTALPCSTCCHTFRATGITTYLQNGGTLERAQAIANLDSPRTTKVYDRTPSGAFDRRGRANQNLTRPP
jgi:hypothetical protein